MTSQLQLPSPVADVVDPVAGERAKQDGMARVGQLDPQWATECDKRIARFAARGIPFQAADLIADGLDEPPHPNCWGARFGKNARDGIIRHHGYSPSKRATVHGSICKTWIGTETARAAA